MSNNRQKVLDALLRQHYPSFLQKAFSTASGGEILLKNWHHDAICFQLERIRQGDITRLIVTMPPRNLKSITLSVAWQAWMLGVDPSLRFVCVSYSNDLARKLANDCRAIMQTDWYRRAFPKTRLQRGNSAEMDFMTTAGGGRLSTSVGGTLTGRGGDMIVIDDPIKPDEAMSETVRKQVINWYSNTLVSRLNDKETGAIILVMQRLHEEDLAGYLLESGDWHHLSLPAIAFEDRKIQTGFNTFHDFLEGSVLHPERESLKRLTELKRTQGTASFSAQYQQNPVPVEGLHIKRAWLQHFKTVPEHCTGDRIVQSWDTASKDGVFNDFSVCVTALLRDRMVYVLDVYRAKLKFPDLKRKVINHAKRWNTGVILIEDAASGQQLLQVLRSERPKGVPRPIARKPVMDKLSRFSGQSHRIEAGELLLQEGANWLADLERELLGFPNVKHDDQVDALTQLLSWHDRHRRIPWVLDELGLGPRVYEG